MERIDSRQRFRQILSGSSCVVPGSVHDPISARIAEDLGFEIGMLGGSVASLTVLGAPDLIVMTLSELADQVRRICRSCTLPIMVDADHGFGNALSVKRTVEELENAGVAALTIEDTLLPQPLGQAEPSLIPISEGVGKMRAAVAGRRDPGLTIVGRTSAAKINGIADAIERCKAYEDAGVDAVFLIGVERRQDLEALCSSIGVPVVLGSVSPTLDDLAYLGEVGVRIMLQPHLPVMAAIQAVYEVLKALREGQPPSAIKGLPSSSLMKRVTRQEDYERWGKHFSADDYVPGQSSPAKGS